MWGLYRQLKEQSEVQKISQQLQSSGWDQAAIKGYLRKTIQLSDKDLAASIANVQTYYLDTFVIGSPIYLTLYRASDLSAKEKIQLVFNQLEAEIDEFHFMHLLSNTYQLDEELAPHAAFYAYFRRDVLRAFPTKEGLNSDELGKKVHLFRTYIDRQNITYIRTHFQGTTDYEKLLTYGKTFHLSFDYTTGARYHNRSMTAFDYPRNMKLQVPKRKTCLWGPNDARMSEFIVRISTGEFVSEWDIYRKLANGRYDSQPNHYAVSELGPVANTESFNYGFSYGSNFDVLPWNHSHEYLDVLYPINPAIRRKALRHWKSPVALKQAGPYLDIVKKPHDAHAWQQIPKVQRPEVYQSYCHYCQKKKIQSGFMKYHQKKI